ncbi:MAG: type I DNA topoisomerase, partial [Pirellulales bacterium]
MAKKSSSGSSKSLVIVESPAKARTIAKFLGRGFQVEASIGHVRDLPQGAKQIPAKYKGEPWAYLGVNVDHDFEPVYVIPPEKLKQVKKLKDLLKDAGELYLATDEDREGEAISWHLCEILKPKVPVRRLVFHEITKEAIEQALAKPRQVNDDLVRAQETRRILDRLYGYEVSPLLWRKVRPKLSAGRVQSVAVRLIVERERQRMAFVAAEYWDLLGTFAKAEGRSFAASLLSVDGRRLPSGKDFDSTTGKLKESKLLQLDEAAAIALVKRLRGGTFRVASLTDRPYTTRPYAPFTTSTLQQEANRKLGWTARRTMQVAQSLYENGHITYMRTDSTNLADVAIDAARELVRSQYGQEYLPETPRAYKSKVKNAQEAHEAIRPAGHPFQLPGVMKGTLREDEFRLFELIWKRTVASQMADARGRRISITIEGEGALFQVGGKTIDFPGYLRAYVEGSDDPNAELADKETVLPSLLEGESLDCLRVEPVGHTTQPPGRYSEAALTRTLEEKGIGRPSTYASIIDTILARKYVFKKGTALVPTWVAFSVVQLLEEHMPDLVDYDFTAQMEDDLDTISRGESAWVEYLRKFYFGDGQPGLKAQLEKKAEQIDARSVCQIGIGQPEGQEPIYVRVGRYGPFLQQGERRASLREDIPPDEMTVEAALELLDQAEQGDEPLGICPETKKPVFLKVGRFGPYVQRGTSDDDEKPQNASLLKGMLPETIDLETALRLLSLPRTLGDHPESVQPVVAMNGRFGPYIKCGSETRSLPADKSPLDVTLDEALALLAQPKTRGRQAAKKEPLRVFDKSPESGEPVQLL